MAEFEIRSCFGSTRTAYSSKIFIYKTLACAGRINDYVYVGKHDARRWFPTVVGGRLASISVACSYVGHGWSIGWLLVPL